MTPDYAGSGHTTPPPKPIPRVSDCCASHYMGGHSRGCHLYVKPAKGDRTMTAFDGTYPVVTTTAGHKNSSLSGSAEGF